VTGVPVIAQRLSGGPLALDKIAKQFDAVEVYEENPRTLVRAARLCRHRGMGVTPSSNPRIRSRALVTRFALPA
jgi:hypothetical protein